MKKKINKFQHHNNFQSIPSFNNGEIELKSTHHLPKQMETILKDSSKKLRRKFIFNILRNIFCQ